MLERGPEYDGRIRPVRSGVVLIADDERAVASALAGVIEDLGYQPVVACDGVQALDLAYLTWPVLLVTDLMMPRLSGSAVIAALHTEAVTIGRPPIPAILLTAAGMQRGQDAGADAVLTKPFDLKDFEHLVLHLLARAE